MNKKKAIILIILLIVAVLFSVITAYASGSNGSWCKITIDQGNGDGAYAPSGCTTCTIVNIIQNSGLITDSANQAKAGAYGQGKADATFDAIFDKMFKGGDWSFRIPGDGLRGESGCIALMNKYCEGANWKTIVSGDKGTGNWTCTVGVSGKKFKNMSQEELVSAFQLFWNNGYYAIVGVQNKGGSSSAASAKSGDETITARHWMMFAGVDDKDIYFNDSSGGKISSKNDKTYKSYWISYVILLKNDKNTILDASNGSKVNASSSTSGGESGANALGIPAQVFAGYCSEQELASYMQLYEADIQSLYLDDAQRDSLSSKELSSLSNWEMNTYTGEESNGLTHFIRTLVQLAGILFTIWMLLLYLAYWFDRVNTLVDIDALGLVSFKQLVISPDESECTFALGSKSSKGGEPRTINHRTLLRICIVGIAFGCLIISGLFYKILMIAIFKITQFLR